MGDQITAGSVAQATKKAGVSHTLMLRNSARRYAAALHLDEAATARTAIDAYRASGSRHEGKRALMALAGGACLLGGDA